MAMMMSLNESIFQAVPGVGILLGGALAALAGPRAALASRRWRCALVAGSRGARASASPSRALTPARTRGRGQRLRSPRSA